MKEQEKNLVEIFQEASKYVLQGGHLPKFSGDKVQVEAVSRATKASRRLYEVLCDENSTLDAVATMLEEKIEAAENFKSVIGREWRL
jgi:hypothetical protein